MSDFQKCLDSSLVNGLRSIYKNHWSLFCDLKISCGDGETVIAPKLILAVHSDYFSALLKHEPETTTISLPQFDSASVTFVIKSLVDFDETDFEDVELGQVVRVADYFQIKALVTIVSDVIITELTTENLQDVLNLNQIIHSPKLEEGCVSFMKTDIQEIFKSQYPLLKSLQKPILLRTFSQPWILLQDQFGRQCDIIETTEHLFYILNQILTASGRVEDLPEFLTHCFKEDYLYYIFTEDFDKVFLPLFRNIPGSIRSKLANIHGHILPKKLDIGVPVTSTITENKQLSLMVNFDALNSLDLKKLVISNCQKPELEPTSDPCTFIESGKSYDREDHYYQCLTCDMKNTWDGIQGYGHSICSACINLCHSNHSVKYVKFGPHFCDCGERGKEICQKLKDSPSDYPGANFHWAPLSNHGQSFFGSHNDVVKTENHQKWQIEGQIRKLNVKSRTWDSRCIIQGIQVFMENGETKAFGMELHDTVRVDSLEVPVGEHIKEFVVRSGFYIDAIGFKTNKDKTFGLIGGNGGSLKNSCNAHMGLFGQGYVTQKGVRPSHHYYVDGIQGITVVTQDNPCICEIQFKYVVVPSSDMYPLRAISHSQDSDSDNLHSNERIIRNLDYWDEYSDSDDSD